MKKIVKYCLCAGLAAFGFAGCNPLEKEPLDVISDAQLWRDPALIDGYLRNCYEEMKFFNEGSQNLGYTSYTTDNVLALATNMSDEACFWAQYNWRHYLYYKDPWPWWNYQVVRKLNIFLSKIESSPIAQKDKLTREGEARFLRAFAYFKMVIRYGGVPLILDVQSLDDPREVLFPKRAKEDDVYQFILDEIDWITANQALPKSLASSDNGRATYWAALALKSRAALYAGSIAKFTQEKGLSTQLVYPSGAVGIDPARAVYYFTQSYNASDEIITEGGFSLFRQYIDGTKAGYTRNFRQLFLTPDHSEVIFAERFSGEPGKGHSWDMWQSPYGYNGWGGGQMSRVFPHSVDAFENMTKSDKTLKQIAQECTVPAVTYTYDQMFGDKDPRFEASIYTEGTVFPDPVLADTLRFYKEIYLPDNTLIKEGSYEGFPSVGFVARTAQPTHPMENYFGVMKYLDMETQYSRSGTNRSTTNWIVFRLAEIYLNRAEAGFETGLGTPLDDVNEVRGRAGMDNLASAGREAIRHERQVELMFEGTRFFDIKRWREADTYLSKNPYSIYYRLEYQSVLDNKADGTPYRYKIMDNGGTYAATQETVFGYRRYYSPLTTDKYKVNTNLEENPGWLEAGGEL